MNPVETLTYPTIINTTLFSTFVFCKTLYTLHISGMRYLDTEIKRISDVIQQTNYMWVLTLRLTKGHQRTQ